jgi:hypothetical protein
LNPELHKEQEKGGGVKTEVQKVDGS